MLKDKLLKQLEKSEDLIYKVDSDLFKLEDGIRSPVLDQLYVKSKNPTIPLRLRVIKTDIDNPINVSYCSKNYLTSLTISGDKITGYWRDDLSNNYLGRPLLTVKVNQLKDIDIINLTEIVLTI